MNDSDSNSNAPSSIDLVERWRQGDEDAAAELYSRYIERMMRVIGGTIPTKMQARVQPEDVVQSVFRTVFRRMQNGEFEFEDETDLWKLLVTIALNKARKQTTRNLAAKRSINREASLGDLTVDESLVERLGSQPSISDVVAFRETLDRLMETLPEDEAELVQLRLEGYTQDEIAARMNITDRTVRRKLNSIRQAIVELLQSEMDSEA